MRTLNIAIAGSGTAGLAAAAMLARDGHRVTIFERFDAARPIGSGLMLQPTGMAVLSAMGLRDGAIARGARIERLHGLAAGRTVLDVRYDYLRRPDGFGTAIHRADLFHLLHGAAVGAGAEIETGREVTSCDERWLHFAHGPADGPFDVIVDATGCRSPLGRQPSIPLSYGALWTSIGAIPGLVPNDTLSQRYWRAHRMAGLLPLGRGGGTHDRIALFWSIRADRHDALIRAGIEEWRESWRALWPETGAYADAVPSLDTMSHAQYSHRTLAAPASGRVIHIGDSWHSTSPQLGQGANQALLDAFALARALRAHDDVDQALGAAIAARRLHVHLYQAMSRLLTPVYQSDGRMVPALRDWVVGPLSTLWPVPQIQAAMVAGLVGRPLDSLGLSGPCAAGAES